MHPCPTTCAGPRQFYLATVLSVPKRSVERVSPFPAFPTSDKTHIGKLQLIVERYFLDFSHSVVRFRRTGSVQLRKAKK
jgi:hypothetical protein